jgi:Na(+)-translocating NADH:ubiquinone oxidoreductase B subunit
MKLVANILEKFRPMFKKDAKFARFHSIFDAADNALFSATHTAKVAPYGRGPVDVKRYMFMVIVALTPAFLSGVYYFGWRVVAMLLVSYIAGGIVEVAFAVVRKEEIYEGFLVTGFIFPMILPPGTPLWMVALGVMFGTLVGKEVFGGTGRNLFNAALVGRCFLAFGYTPVMAASWAPAGEGAWGRLLDFTLARPDAVSTATPLVLAKGGEFVSLLDLFIGRVAGSVGETSALAILLGGAFLLLVGIASWRTVCGVLVSFTALGAILHNASPEAVPPIQFSLLSGGILFGAFFMATDPVTSPTTVAGRWAYGLLIGSVTILIRCFSGYVEGVTFAILFGNICAPLIDEVVIRAKIRGYARER